MCTQPASRPATEQVAPIEPGRWSVVPVTSTAIFSVRELGLVTVRGSVPVVGGVVEVDGAGRPVSVRASLDVRGLTTGNARRDRDLRGPKFLAAGRWPAISFASREVHVDGPGWTVVGTLVVRDVRSPLTLDVRLAGSAPGGGRRAVATAALDRREAGVRTGPTFLIGGTVRVSLDVTLVPPRP